MAKIIPVFISRLCFLCPKAQDQSLLLYYLLISSPFQVFYFQISLNKEAVLIMESLGPPLPFFQDLRTHVRPSVIRG